MDLQGMGTFPWRQYTIAKNKNILDWLTPYLVGNLVIY